MCVCVVVFWCMWGFCGGGVLFFFFFFFWGVGLGGDWEGFVCFSRVHIWSTRCYRKLLPNINIVFLNKMGPKQTLYNPSDSVIQAVTHKVINYYVRYRVYRYSLKTSCLFVYVLICS